LATGLRRQHACLPVETPFRYTHGLQYTSVTRLFSCLTHPPPSSSSLFPYTTLFRSVLGALDHGEDDVAAAVARVRRTLRQCSARSEEHTSELQSRRDLVCRLLLEKKNRRKSVPGMVPCSTRSRMIFGHPASAD